MAGLGTAFHPDAAMVYGVYDVRGDSPVSFTAMSGSTTRWARRTPSTSIPSQLADPWLDRLGVRWVMGGPAEEPPPDLGWKIAYAGSDARVWERPGALPLARLAGGTVRIERRGPGAWTLGVRTPGPNRVIVAETRDPGWAGHVDGRPAPVEPHLGILLRVAVGPGPSRVELRYHPDGFAAGTGLSLLGLAAVAFGAVRGRRQA